MFCTTTDVFAFFFIMYMMMIANTSLHEQDISRGLVRPDYPGEMPYGFKIFFVMCIWFFIGACIRRYCCCCRFRYIQENAQVNIYVM